MGGITTSTTSIAVPHSIENLFVKLVSTMHMRASGSYPMFCVYHPDQHPLNITSTMSVHKNLNIGCRHASNLQKSAASRARVDQIVSAMFALQISLGWDVP